MKFWKKWPYWVRGILFSFIIFLGFFSVAFFDEKNCTSHFYSNVIKQGVCSSTDFLSDIFASIVFPNTLGFRLLDGIGFHALIAYVILYIRPTD